jgi:hypothetical protein
LTASAFPRALTDQAPLELAERGEHVRHRLTSGLAMATEREAPG